MPSGSPATTRIIAETPANDNCFVGFHDITPWSPDESCLAIHRAAPELHRMEDCGKPIEICVWRPLTDEIEPGTTDTLVFNTVEHGRAVAVLKNIVTGARSVLPSPIYVISPDGKTSISPNFCTLAHRWRAYGCKPLRTMPLVSDQDSDGLWLLDIETGKQRLFISTSRAARFEAVPSANPSSHFLCHTSFSPDGTRVIFLHRFFSSDGALFTRMIATDRDARHLVLLAQEKVSHFDWFKSQRGDGMGSLRYSHPTEGDRSEEGDLDCLAQLSVRPHEKCQGVRSVLKYLGHIEEWHGS